MGLVISSTVEFALNRIVCIYRSFRFKLSVVSGFFKRIGKYVVGFVDLLEFFLGLLISHIVVRVIAHGQALVSSFDLGRAGAGS